MRTSYVVGFLFYGSEVLLVQKNRPIWQAGLWNGVGGRCEVLGGHTESSEAAMPREFEEETGIVTSRSTWTRFATEIGSDYQLYCYKARIETVSPPPSVPPTNDVGEALAWWKTPIPTWANLVGNLSWMIPLALDWRRPLTAPIFIFNDNISERPTW
jgi:8-oxo-dGTP pyrophosphatase MutT (NUDIX family)